MRQRHDATIAGTIRRATLADADAIHAIYAPFVRHTAVSFEEHASSVAEMKQRIAAALRDHLFIVHENGGAIPSYACSSPHRAQRTRRPPFARGRIGSTAG